MNLKVKNRVGCQRMIIVSTCLMAVSQVVSARAAGVDPTTVSAVVRAGDCITINKTVHTPPIPPKPDIVFLADNTGSMGDAIDNVQANASSILSAVDAADPDAQFGVAYYTDFACTDPFPYQLLQPITPNNGDVISAINLWAPGNGCDVPEAQLNALYQLATTGAGFRPGSTKIIVWFGDSNGHDPSNGHSLNNVINALVGAGIRVIAVPVDTGIGYGNGLNTGGQATAITTATGGVLLPGATSDQVAAAILAGLGNLPVTVSPQVSQCDDLTVSFDKPSQTVISGEDAVFVEKICVPANASQCGSLACEVEWLLDGSRVKLPDGSSDPAFVESIKIAVPDVTPPTIVCSDMTVNTDLGLCSAVVRTYNVKAADNCPGVSISCTPPPGSTFPKGKTVVTCTATDASGNMATCSFIVTVLDKEPPKGVCVQATNPNGVNVPGSKSDPQSGQNPDGFYLLLAKDNCDPSPKIFIEDTGSSFVAGPFTPGSTVKITQAPGVSPNQKPMSGVVVAHIQLKGDALLIAVDADGNLSAPSDCKVPPPPK